METIEIIAKQSDEWNAGPQGDGSAIVASLTLADRSHPAQTAQWSWQGALVRP